MKELDRIKIPIELGSHGTRLLMDRGMTIQEFIRNTIRDIEDLQVYGKSITLVENDNNEVVWAVVTEETEIYDMGETRLVIFDRHYNTRRRPGEKLDPREYIKRMKELKKKHGELYNGVVLVEVTRQDTKKLSVEVQVSTEDYYNKYTLEEIENVSGQESI